MDVTGAGIALLPTPLPASPGSFSVPPRSDSPPCPFTMETSPSSDMGRRGGDAPPPPTACGGCPVGIPGTLATRDFVTGIVIVLVAT